MESGSVVARGLGQGWGGERAVEVARKGCHEGLGSYKKSGTLAISMSTSRCDIVMPF